MRSISRLGWSVVLAWALVGWVALSSEAATYHVATFGSDSVSCTTAQNQGSPRATPDGGMACLQGPGDELVIAGGTYDKPGTGGWKPPSGRSGDSFNNPIRVRGATGATVILHPSIDMGEAAGNRYWIFQDLIIDNQSRTQLAIWMATLTRLENVELINATHSGMQGCTGGGCEFINVKSHGHGRGVNGECINNPDPETGQSGQCHGLYISEGGGHLVDGGEYYDNEGSGLHFYPDTVSTTVRNARLHHNQIHGLQLVRGGGTHQVYNNLAYNNGYHGLGLHQAGTVEVYNNTSYGNGQWGLDNSATNTITRNNILSNNGFGPFSQPGTFSNNLCWPAQAGFSCAVTGDPGFVSDIGGDFKIAEIGSPAVGAAPRLSAVLTDHEGATRNDPTTIGAYEFDGTVEPPQLPPVGKVGEWLFEANANSTAAVPDSNPVRFHHGTLVGNAAITAPGLVGSGKLTLDGDGDYVQISGHADLAPATQFVILARIDPASLAGRQEIYNAGDSIGFFHEDGNLNCFYYNGSSWIEAKTTMPVVGLTVQHVACGKRQGHATLADGLIVYHEGAQVHFTPTTGTINYGLGTDVFIGRHGTTAGSYFNGDLDSVRFYANVRPTQMGVENDFNELTPQIGFSVRDMAFMKADALEGQVLGVNQDRTHRLGSAIGLRFSITKGSE